MDMHEMQNTTLEITESFKLENPVICASPMSHYYYDLVGVP